MGIIAKEAGRSSIAMTLGLVVGTINTVLVLPRAFEGFEAHWGLLRVLTAWSQIISPIVLLGAGSIIVRQSQRVQESLRGSLYASAWLIASFGMLIWGGVVWWKGDWLIAQMDGGKTELLPQNLHLFFLMNVLVLSITMANQMLVIAMRASWGIFIQDLWLKATYLALALLLLYDCIDLQTMVQAYVGTWALGLIGMILGIVHAKVPFSFRRLRELNWKENLQLSGYTSLAGGAAVMATNLDFVMVSMILGLSEVPVYTMGFFIASVVQIPQRSIGPAFNGLTAMQFATQPPAAFQPAVQQATRVNLLLAVVVMAGVWAGLPQLTEALPSAYRNITGVVLAIGLQKVILASSDAANSVFVHTPHYRMTLPLNIGLLVATVFTNWLFMSYLEMGVTGAAIATLITAIWNATWRITILYRKVGIHPFTRSWLAILGAGTIVAVPMYFLPLDLLGNHGYVESILRGAIASAAVLGLTYFTGQFPELRSAIEKHLLPRLK